MDFSTDMSDLAELARKIQANEFAGFSASSAVRRVG